MLGRSRDVVLGRTRSDPTQLSDSTRRGGRSRLVVRRPWQDERLPGSHIGTGLSVDRGEQRRENVRGGGSRYFKTPPMRQPWTVRDPGRRSASTTATADVARTQADPRHSDVNLRRAGADQHTAVLGQRRRPRQRRQPNTLGSSAEQHKNAWLDAASPRLTNLKAASLDERSCDDNDVRNNYPSAWTVG
jgi:hypothetical protein